MRGKWGRKTCQTDGERGGGEGIGERSDDRAEERWEGEWAGEMREKNKGKLGEESGQDSGQRREEGERRIGARERRRVDEIDEIPEPILIISYRIPTCVHHTGLISYSFRPVWVQHLFCI